MGAHSSHMPPDRVDLVEARLRERSQRLTLEQRDTPSSFIYEPSVPPTIPPEASIAEWRARQRRPAAGR